MQSSSLLLVLVVLSCLSPSILSASILWTGQAGNPLWSSPGNWVGNAVPTNNDDVTINAVGGAQVSVSQPAVARSLTIGGGTYAQTLTLLSQLSVGVGGIAVNFGGTLDLQSNSDLPLSSNGAVVFTDSTFNFQSGNIQGTGTYTIKNGAVLQFLQASLKQISGTSLVSYGSITVQPTTIRLAASASIVSYGNFSAVGGIQILGDQTSSLSNYGAFTYQGPVITQPLNFQLTTMFYSPLQITSGAVQISADFKSNSSVSIPPGASFTVSAGQFATSFNVISGNGEFVVAGEAQISGPSAVSTLSVTDSGNATFLNSATFSLANVGGILGTTATVGINNLTLAGGTLTGSGTFNILTYLYLTFSDNQNSNVFISSTVVVGSLAEIDKPVYLLFGAGGLLKISDAANFYILAAATFGLQSSAGSPHIELDGTISVTLSSGTTLTCSVPIEGGGSFNVNSGFIVFNGIEVTLGTLFLSVSSFVNFQNAIVDVDTITGTGGFNLTAQPTPISTIGTISLSYVGVLNGPVDITSFAVQTFSNSNGVIKLSTSSTNSASTALNLYGGELDGSAAISTGTLTIYGVLPVYLKGVTIKATSFALAAPDSGDLQFSLGSAIVVA